MKGKLIIPSQFDEIIRDFENGFAIVRNKDNRWSVNKDGTEIPIDDG